MYKSILAIICTAALLAGCGLKGPLYLPTQTAASPSKATAVHKAAKPASSKSADQGNKP